MKKNITRKKCVNKRRRRRTKTMRRRRHNNTPQAGGTLYDDALMSICSQTRDEPGQPTRLERVRELIEEGANVNSENFNPMNSPVISCIRSGNVEILRYLLSRGASPNKMAGSRITDPKFIAVLFGNKDCLEILLSAPGADVNVRDINTNNTLLNSAVYEYSFGFFFKKSDYKVQRTRSDYLAIINMLVAHGDDINARQQDDKTILMAATETNIGEEARVLVNVLIGHGADLNAVQKPWNHTVLWRLASGQTKKMSREDCLLMAELLISKGADQKIVAEDGTTALEIAKRKGFASYVEKFDKVARRGPFREVLQSIKKVDENSAIMKVLQDENLQRLVRSYLG